MRRPYKKLFTKWRVFMSDDYQIRQMIFDLQEDIRELRESDNLMSSKIYNNELSLNNLWSKTMLLSLKINE